MPNPFLWLIALPLAASPVNYLAGRISVLLPGRRAARAGGFSPAQALGLLALLLTAVPFARAAQLLAAAGPQVYTFGALSLRLDGVSLALSGLALLLGAGVMLFSGPYLAGEAGEEKYYALLTAMVGAMVGLACAADLFNLWLWFETMAISSYLLVAFHREQPGALEAGIKYLVQSAVGSVCVLFGIALTLGATGSLSLTQALAQPGDPLVLAAGALFLVGFGVKAALVPLHTWLPDAHSQAPSGVSAMLSGVVIAAGLVALLRALGPLAGATPLWGPILLGVAALNLLLGNLLALRQTQVKRLLAFSSIAHMGYLLLGLGAAVTYGSAAAGQGAFFHLVAHGLMKGLAFLAAGALLYGLHIRLGSHAPLLVSDLAGASRRYPLAALAFSLAVLGLGGLPPLVGFFSKWQIFAAGFETGSPAMIGLVLFAAFNSVLSLGYYAPLVNLLYRRQPGALAQAGAPLPWGMQAALLALLALVVALGVWPSLVSWLTAPAGAALLAVFGL